MGSSPLPPTYPHFPSPYPSSNTCLRVFTDMSHRTCNILHSILSRVSVSALRCLYLLSAERERRRATGGVRRVGREGGGKANIVYFRRSCLNVDCQMIVRYLPPSKHRCAALRVSTMMIFVSGLSEFSISISVSTPISI